MRKIMDYERALVAARNGNAMLFFGAGFSYGLSSATGKELPTGKNLAEILCNEVNIKITDDLKLASKKYLRSKSAEELINLLKDHFLVQNVGSEYNKIAAVPWRSVYTTNYDNSFEISALNNGIIYDSIDIEKNPRQSASKKRVIHINGYINNLDEEKLHTSFKLTNTSYLTEQFRASVWSEVFKRDIQSAHAIFFAGYSLYDIDIQEILFAEQHIRDKIFFIERSDLTQEDIEDSELNSFGKIIPKGILSFADDLTNVDPLALDDLEELIVTSFDMLKPENASISVNDTEVVDLLLGGNFNDNLIYNDVSLRNEKYILLREILNEASASLSKKENLIIFSDLANGKTIFSKTIAVEFFNKSYYVFFLKDDYLKDYAFKEINDILKKYPKVLFIIENYSANLDVVSHINTSRNIETKLILTSRTHEHERTENELFYSKAIINIHSTAEISLDKLTDLDIEKIVDFMDLYGLWGEKSSFKREQKILYIKVHANREFHGVLLGLLESPQVAKRIESFFKEISESNTLMMNIVAILCLAVTNINNPNLHMVAAITNSSAIFESSFRKNSVFQQLISRTNDVVLAKSSVLAEFILTKFPNSTMLVNCLVEIAKNARSKANGNELYFNFYKDIASFRYIQKILPEKGKRESLVLFYQGLKEIPEERVNPHFWLQYAIARLSYPDKSNLTNAKNHLDTALSLAKGRSSYWTDDIETQYARYYLECAINSHSKAEKDIAFKDFNLAVDGILRIHKGGRHRVELFRPIILVENFYNKYKTELTKEHIEIVLEKCILLSDIISKSSCKFDHDIRFRLAQKSVKNVISDIKLTNHLKDHG